jgi:hypothetical protein
VCISHFSCYSVSLTTFQVIQCLCFFFHVFQFSRNIPCPTVCISPFLAISLFLIILRFVQCVFHFALFSVFLAIVHVLPWEFFIFLVCQFSHHIPGPTVCVLHFIHFSVFVPQSRSYSVHFSFITFSMFLAVFQVLQGVFHILHVFSVFLAIFQVLP